MGLRTTIGWHLWKQRVKANRGVCTSRGVRLQTNHALVSDQVAFALYRGDYENAEHTLLRDRVRPDDVVLELGCGMGFIGLVCAKRLKTGRLIGVEANPRLLPLIRENFRLNELEIELIHAAVSNQPGRVEVCVSDDFRYSGIDLSEQYERVSVPGVKLNELLDQHQPTFLVLDIEGMETSILNNEASLDSVRSIAVEVHANLTGDAAISRMLSVLFDKGFVLDTGVSRFPVLLLSREGRR